VASIICGVDVSLKTLDGRIGGSGLELSVRRDPEGIAALARFCAEHGVELVVMEATGGYEKLPFGLLWEAGVPCAIANARSVRRFAEAMGVLEKTDRIDARIIADYARARGWWARLPRARLRNGCGPW
jgi:transposase